MVRLLAIMFVLLILWTITGRLDIVAVAPGKLVPHSYVKIVQPSEAGVIKEILVRDGESVSAGQVLMRMDALAVDADVKSLEAEYQRKQLTLRRIDAELADRNLEIDNAAPDPLVREILAQYHANRAALAAALAEERTRLQKARQDTAAAQQVKAKLEATLPYYREQDIAYEKLANVGFVGPLMAGDKHRVFIEKEQELKTQNFVIASANASIVESDKKLVQIESDYRRRLSAERNEVASSLEKLTQDLAKQAHRRELMELRAPQEGFVKELATHTAGTVVQPGTILLTLVPAGDTLRAEVWVGNDDIGFVRPGQAVKVKLSAFPFQQYGMVDGLVEQVGADSADGSPATGTGAPPEHVLRGQPLLYRTLVALKKVYLDVDGDRLPLSPGMQATAEIHLGERSVLGYLLSPVQKAWHEAARER